MGLFSKFISGKKDVSDKNTAVNPTAMFSDAVAAYRAADCDEGRLAACEQLLAAFPSVKESDIAKIVKSEGRKGTGYYYHDVLGFVDKGDAFGVKVYDNLVKTKQNLSHHIEKNIKFRASLDAIPNAPVVIDTSAGKTERHTLADMPDISYTNVTAKFNPDRLPSFVVIDTETNGVQIQGGRILELSAIRYEDFQPVAVWTTLVNPGKPIPAEATAVNHITDDMVADAPTLAQVAASFTEFVGSSALVGYNLPFDLKFLYSRGVDLMAQKRKYYDVLELARKAFKNDLDRFRLVDVAEECDIPISDAHRSFVDCYTTGLVFKICIDRITGRW